MTAPIDYTETRIKKRSLPDLLVHKFLTEYGYDHGPVIARAIVHDILATIEQCYPDRVPPRTVVWLAVRREKRGQRKGLTVAFSNRYRIRKPASFFRLLLSRVMLKRNRASPPKIFIEIKTPCIANAHLCW